MRRAPATTRTRSAPRPPVATPDGSVSGPPARMAAARNVKWSPPKREDLVGAPGRTRTCDARFRKPTLYPLSYGGSGWRVRTAHPPGRRSGSPAAYCRRPRSSGRPVPASNLFLGTGPRLPWNQTPSWRRASTRSVTTTGGSAGSSWLARAPRWQSDRAPQQAPQHGGQWLGGRAAVGVVGEQQAAGSGRSAGPGSVARATARRRRPSTRPCPKPPSPARCPGARHLCSDAVPLGHPLRRRRRARRRPVPEGSSG